MQRIYVDTNVLLFWLLPSNSDASKSCTDFIEDVESGMKYYGLISHLVLNEMIKGIRNILVRKNKTDESLWKNEVERALRAIYELNENFIIISGTAEEVSFDTNMNFGAISIEATNLIKNYQGTARVFPNQIVHDGLSTIDTFHAVLARKMKCNQIATYDNDFDELSDYIPRMNIKEEYPQ